MPPWFGSLLKKVWQHPLAREFDQMSLIKCFLSDRRHAVRETAFIQYLNIQESQIQESQEEEIIREIQAKQISLVLISNRYRSEEVGVGHFGKTHRRRLARYIKKMSWFPSQDQCLKS